MKIGIVTFYRAANYGAMLQAYAVGTLQAPGVFRGEGVIGVRVVRWSSRMEIAK